MKLRLIILFTFLSLRLFATHIVGGEIYYDCSRMSPFCDKNIINYAASKEIEIDPNLKKVLIDRQNKKEINIHLIKEHLRSFENEMDYFSIVK